MNQEYYIHKNGTITSLGDCEPQTEKLLFRNAINDRLCDFSAQKIYGVEIGVLDGETSAFFLNNFTNLILYGIDPIIPDSMESSLIGSYDRIMELTKPHADRYKFIKNYSFMVADTFEDNSLDFVFIDGDHTYEAVKVDFEMYFPKVRHGGLIFMHDSRMNRGGANFHVGSSKFCDELISTYFTLYNTSLVGEAFSLTCFIKN